MSVDLAVNGHRVTAGTGGRSLERDRPLLLLLHGAGMDHTVWALVMRALAYGGYSVLAPDLPGHGSSEGPIPATVEEYADWAAALIGAAGFPSGHVAGHSMGTGIALHLAATRPDLCDSLILLGTAATMPVHPDLQAAADAGDHKAIDLIMSWSLAPRAHLSRHPVPGLAMRSGVARLLESVDAAALASDLRASGGYTTALDDAAAVTCPTLLILGEHDLMTPMRNAAPLVQAFGDASTVRLTGTGHMMMVEEPNGVIDATRAFLASVRSQEARP